MTEFPDERGDGNEVSPLNLADIRLRLIHGDPGECEAHVEVIREMNTLGAAASPLIPVLVDVYRADKLKGVGVSSLVKLYLQSPQKELLDALREKGAFCSLNAWERCALFEAGVSELEPELRNYLWQCWEKADNPDRSQVAKSLGQAGGPQALEMLRVIRYKMAGQVQEARAQSGGPSDQDALNVRDYRRRSEVDAHESFLEGVRMAIKRMEERGIR